MNRARRSAREFGAILAKRRTGKSRLSRVPSRRASEQVWILLCFAFALNSLRIEARFCNRGELRRRLEPSP